MFVFSPVRRCNSRSGVAYRTCGNLHEFNVRENRISISSVNSRGSECSESCGPMEDALNEFHELHKNIHTQTGTATNKSNSNNKPID